MYLYCNAAAAFDIYDIFGYDKNVAELMLQPGSIGYGNTLRIAVILAEQGELYRRWEGRTPAPDLSIEELCRILSPRDFVALKKAALEAVRLGFTPTVEDKTAPKVRDKGLEELEKKTKQPSSGRTTSTL